jgi:hypothetical protein
MKSIRIEFDPPVSVPQNELRPPQGIGLQVTGQLCESMDAPTMVQALTISVLGGLAVRVIVDWLIPFFRNHAVKRCTVQGKSVSTDEASLTAVITAAAGEGPKGTAEKKQ